MQKRISTVLAVLIPILALAALVTILIVFTASDSSGTSDENSAEAIEDSSGIETNTNNSDAGASPYSTAASLTVKNGDTVEVKVTFHEDFGNEELNGKDAVFEVVINEIYK